MGSIKDFFAVYYLFNKKNNCKHDSEDYAIKSINSFDNDFCGLIRFNCKRLLYFIF